MSLFDVFNIAGSSMSAQSIRLNITASNLANADTVASSPEEVYKTQHAIFAATLQGVQVTSVVSGNEEPQVRYEPGHPLANEEGYIFSPNISVVNEMVNMISASRSYQTNVEVMDATKQMLMSILRLGQ